MPEIRMIPPRVQLTDPKTGLISREWYQFLMRQAGTVEGSALLKVDDTNVTLTLGGSPNTALLARTILTLGWKGQLSIERGGTGASTAEEARTALGAAAIVHDHAIEELTGLQTALDTRDAANLASANAYTDAAVAGITGSSFSADDIVTVPDGDSFALVFTDDGNLVAVG